jgi:hypothetical protein
MTTLLQTNLPDLYLDTALPWIEHVIEEKFDEFPRASEVLYNMRDMRNGIVQHTQVSSLGAAPAVGEAQEIPQDRVFQGYSTTFLAVKYALMLATSQESIDHEKFDSISKNPRKMARGMNTTVETVASAILNTGFTTNGSDGVPLFSTAHPLLTPGAGTSSNRLAVDSDLATTSLKNMIELFNKQLDTAGNKIQIPPKYLWIPGELEHTAFQLLHSIYLPGGSQNDVSSFGPQGLYRLEAQVWWYLTDPDAWGLMAEKDDHDIYFYWDKRPEVKSQMEFKSDVALTRMIARFVAGYSDWRGVTGTPGAA